MSDRGKYHGQRLKTKDVLRDYAAGERDFRGSILRGCHFEDADLSGADFTGADIRDVQFIDTDLLETKFCSIKTSLQLSQSIFEIIKIAAVALVAGVIQGTSGSIISGFHILGSPTNPLGIVAGLIPVIVAYFIIWDQGFNIRALKYIIYSAILSLALVVAVSIIKTTDFAEAQSFAVSVVVSVIGAFAVSATGGAFALALAIIIAILCAFSTHIALAIALVTSLSAAISVGVLIANGYAGSIAIYGACICAFINFIFTVIIICFLRQDDHRFWPLRLRSIAFSATGTKFIGADLTRASFANSDLNRANFSSSSQRPILLKNVRWRNVENFERTFLGFEYSNLDDPWLRDLLVSLDGVNRDFSYDDLRGVNLAGATLHRINLIGADLNGATLAGAELHGANLTNAQCVGTDFTGAHLTGACLEAWNIDETTILKDIDCQYVFLKAEPDAQGNRERRPHNPDKIFQPGDFEKFFKEMLDTVQILIRQGIHPQVFRDTLAQLMADYHLPDDAVQGYERKGEDMLVTVAVPPGTNKGKFEQDFDELQALKLEAARARGLLEGERKRADDLKAIMLSLGPAASNVTVTTTAMTHSNNPNISAADGSFVNTGNNLQGNVINLGEISGQVSLHYGQDADKILQTLESLQSYAQTFPETEKEAVQVHLEDLTHDLQQFKKPSPARLKTRLMGLLRIAVALGTGIATATDFANNVLELADKLAVPIEVLEPQLREFKAIHPNFDWQPPDNSELEHK